MRLFYLCLVFASVIGVLLIQGAQGAHSEAAPPQGAASCGCDKLRRDGAQQHAEEGSDSAAPAHKYSEGANGRPQGQVFHHCRLFVLTLLNRSQQGRHLGQMDIHHFKGNYRKKETPIAIAYTLTIFAWVYKNVIE